MPVGDAFFCAVEGKPRGVAPCPHQRLCLWTPRRVFDPLDTHFAIELSALSGYARVLIRARRREIPLHMRKSSYGRKPNYVVAPIWRDNMQQVGESSLGALLRERKVTGRDASLPAPLLIFPLEWSPVKQLGRCPKPHKGRRPLTPQGTLSLDPFLCPGLSSLPYFFFSGAFFAFSFAFFS